MRNTGVVVEAGRKQFVRFFNSYREAGQVNVPLNLMKLITS